MTKTKKVVVAAVVPLMLLFGFYLLFVHYTDINQVAVVWNTASGRRSLDSVAGFNLTGPLVRVSRIDIRPQRVCVYSSGRVYNCKLVRFDPRAWEAFVALEGARYYWLGNRISFNWGYDEEYRGIEDLLRGYAFSPTKYPFLVIEREYGDLQTK